MKILHTADWHVGCYSDDLNRLPELKIVLNEIVQIANEQNVDIVLIAGDIYESFLPSSESEKLVYETLINLCNNGNRAVVVVAGNHDDCRRLTNANAFSNKFNIYFAGDLSPLNVCLLEDKNITAIRSGSGFIEFKKTNGEKAVVGMLPFPSYYRFNEIKSENQNFNDKVKLWLAPCVAEFSNDTINLLVSHLLTYPQDCSKLDFENFELVGGLTSFIDTNNLKTKAHYTALGHIHQPVCISNSNNIYYSGSPINKYFDNRSNKNEVVVAEINAVDGVKEIKHIPLNAKIMMLIETNNFNEAINALKVNNEKLIKLNFIDMNYVDPNEIKKLRKEFPNLISVSVIPKIANKKFSEVTKKGLSNKEIFVKFIEEKTGKKPSHDLTELFLEIMEDITYETN